MNYKLEEHRDILIKGRIHFPKKINACKSPMEIQQLIVKLVKYCISATDSSIIYVSLSSLTIQKECPLWEKLINLFQDTLVNIAKADGYEIEKFSAVDTSIVIMLPKGLEPGQALFGGIIRGGIDSMMHFKKKEDLLIELFIKTTDLIIKKAGEVHQIDWAEKQARDIVKSVMTESVNKNSMDNLVNIIQTTSDLHQVKAKVSHKGSELIINTLEPNLVNQFYVLMDILVNKNNYSSNEIAEAENFFLILKETTIKSIQAQSPEEEKLYKNAGVKIYTFQIDENHIFSIDYY